MDKKDNSERIERYLREQMTPEENEAFLNDLRNDKELREEAQMMALLIKAMKEEQENFTTDLIAFEEETTEPMLYGTHSEIGIILTLFDQYYTPYEMSSSQNSDDEVTLQELSLLFNKVGTELNVTTVTDRLQAIYDDIRENSEDYSKFSNYENSITWYLALAYTKANKYQKAIELLKPLVDDEDSKAKRLLEELTARYHPDRNSDPEW